MRAITKIRQRQRLCKRKGEPVFECQHILECDGGRRFLEQGRKEYLRVRDTLFSSELRWSESEGGARSHTLTLNPNPEP